MTTISHRVCASPNTRPTHTGRSLCLAAAILTAMPWQSPVFSIAVTAKQCQREVRIAAVMALRNTQRWHKTASRTTVQVMASIERAHCSSSASQKKIMARASPSLAAFLSNKQAAQGCLHASRLAAPATGLHAHMHSQAAPKQASAAGHNNLLCTTCTTHTLVSSAGGLPD